MLKGIEFLRRKSRAFKTLQRTLSSLQVKRSNPVTSIAGGEIDRLLRCARNDDRQGEVGRSMIEMLGVLAIIAVLSVGGLAGYSRALEKWQENKQIEQLSELFYNSINNFDLFEKDYFKQEIDGYVKYGGITVLESIDAIPVGMTVRNGAIWDSYNNTYTMSYGRYICRGIGRCPFTQYWSISFNVSNNKLAYNSEKQCKNFLTVLKNFDDFVREVEFRGKNSEDNSYNSSSFVYGKKHCVNGKLCFGNLTPADVVNYCRSCSKQRCYFNLEISPN